MLSEITIIDELMSRIQKKLGLSTKPRPCECFDLIGGTGTGGLLAILFGRLGMTMDEVTRACVDIVERTSGKRLSLSDTLFSASELENIMGEIVLKHTGRSDTAMIDESTRNSCKVMVCAMYADAIRPGFTPAIRSYKVPKNQGPECTIVEAVRATTATPGIFKPKVIMEHGIKITYMDAGLGCNNPSERLLPETDLVFPGDSVATIISVGAGQQHTISIPSPSPFVPASKNNSFAAVKAIATDCEDINQRVSERFRGTKNVFFRFNAEQGMQDIDRADATRLAEIRVHTRNYMGHVSVSGLLDEAANSVTNRKGTVKVCGVCLFLLYYP
ncbi:FabD/lysophospholipase-like protein [Ceratobasidium sp. AG-I]|nr:FabD/lysophospholipase-like protein [Ceratobasidium sp. AG-I]